MGYGQARSRLWPRAISVRDFAETLFERAVGTVKNRRNIDPPTPRTNPRGLTLPPFLLGNWGIDGLGLCWRWPGRAAQAIRHADFGIRIAVHARLDRGGLGDKAGHQCQQCKEDTLH